MIRCSHCGKLAPTGATSCQSCGMPLTPTNNGVGSVASGQLEQPELPAWLESLRAHERPVSSGPGGQPFSMGELEDENSMPSWMRRDQPGISESGMSDSFPAISSVASPDSGQVDQQAFSAQGLNAGSLIDEQSLPSWMRASRESGPSGPAQNVSGNSLVQPDSLPSWMQDLAQTPQTPQPPFAGGRGQDQYGMPQTPMTPSLSNDMARMPRTPPLPLSYGEMGQGSGVDHLADGRAAPPWMTNAQGPGQQGQNPSAPTGSGFAASDLVDQQSLPPWMRQLQGQDKSDPVSAMGVPVSGSGQGTGQNLGGGVGMPAASLLDVNSLPSWMNEAGQNRSNSGSLQGTQPGGMSAGSLLDANALPEWLRNTDGVQQPGGGRVPPQQPMRPVPSRPRGEAAPQGQSEMAANVFTSMLGVSASAPQFPGQMPPAYNNLGVAQVPPPQQQLQGQGQPMAQPMAGWQPQQPQGNQGLQPPPSWQISGSIPVTGRGSMPNNFAMPSEQRDTSGKLQTQAGGMQNPGYPNMARPDGSNAGYGSMANSNGRGNRDAQAGVTRKKSFFDSIRDFFFK